MGLPASSHPSESQASRGCRRPAQTIPSAFTAPDPWPLPFLASLQGPEQRPPFQNNSPNNSNTGLALWGSGSRQSSLCTHTSNPQQPLSWGQPPLSTAYEETERLSHLPKATLHGGRRGPTPASCVPNHRFLPLPAAMSLPPFMSSDLRMKEAGTEVPWTTVLLYKMGSLRLALSLTERLVSKGSSQE